MPFLEFDDGFTVSQDKDEDYKQPLAAYEDSSDQDQDQDFSSPSGHGASLAPAMETTPAVNPTVDIEARMF